MSNLETLSVEENFLEIKLQNVEGQAESIRDENYQLF
jgi:hypothetical protein